MSRIAKAPIIIPVDVNINIDGQTITVKGKNGELTYTVNDIIGIEYKDRVLTLRPHNDCINSWIQTGTSRAILNSMIIGVASGFIKKLQLIGVGYRAIVNNNAIILFVGFSHSINYQLPAGIIAECPSQTEIVLKSANKQLIGQVAADLRAYRCPEPYKGKGIRYIDECIRIKETKKK